MYNRIFCLLLLQIYAVAFYAQPSVIDLNGKWILSDIEEDKTYTAEVPGTVHTDLLHNKAIPDPYYRDNEKAVKYLENKNWKYSRQFQLTAADLQYSNVELVCDGLDTYAEIIINGHSLAKTDNMFRQWKFDAKKWLQVGENIIDIIFTSPFQYHDKAAKNLGYVFPASNEKGDYKFNPFCRKAAYQFGWDWGPRLVTAGIWQDIYLHQWNKAHLVDYAIQTKSISDSVAIMQVNMTIDVNAAINIDIDIDGFVKRSFSLTSGTHDLVYTFSIKNPILWWPNGAGKSHLYKTKVKLTNKDQLLQEKDIQFGIRTVELVHEKDSIGTAFYFKINDKAIFMKGANYIPQDLFVPRVEEQQYRNLLQAAKSANMNMLRVWGGGIYEQDIFYELCDSLGLLVWQDLMFACTMYPTDEAFFKNVEAEIEYQVQRLSKHPALAIWCGNNEVEVAWNNWGWQKQYNYSEETQIELWAGYETLFKRRIPTLLKHTNTTLPYTSTSPLSNWGTAENFNHSSMHYWGVWHGNDNVDAYKDNVGRFMSEYGMQSYPEMSTILQFADSTDCSLDSDVMTNRQKSYIGNKEILRQVELYYQTPSTFEEFIELSQEIQAKGMQMATSAHINSNGHCMGTLVWQLNDCWPGPTWSIIDYYGKKKKAYHSIKAEFE